MFAIFSNTFHMINVRGKKKGYDGHFKKRNVLGRVFTQIFFLTPFLTVTFFSCPLTPPPETVFIQYKITLDPTPPPLSNLEAKSGFIFWVRRSYMHIYALKTTVF